MSRIADKAKQRILDQVAIDGCLPDGYSVDAVLVLEKAGLIHFGKVPTGRAFKLGPPPGGVAADPMASFVTTKRRGAERLPRNRKIMPTVQAKPRRADSQPQK